MPKRREFSRINVRNAAKMWGNPHILATLPHQLRTQLSTVNPSSTKNETMPSRTRPHRQREQETHRSIHRSQNSYDAASHRRRWSAWTQQCKEPRGSTLGPLNCGGAGNRTRVRAGFFRTSTCVAALSLLGPGASCGTAPGGPATVSFSACFRDRSNWLVP